jgi:hypothetical protein
MTAFSREISCPDCGREYLLSGTRTDTASETEALAHFRCCCGQWMGAFVPTSVPRDRLIVTLSASDELREELLLEEDAKTA